VEGGTSSTPAHARIMAHGTESAGASFTGRPVCYLAALAVNGLGGWGDAEVCNGKFENRVEALGVQQLTCESRFYCWGPSKPPMAMTKNENEEWHAHLTTPVIFNHHKPVEINEKTIEHVDLNPIKSTPKGDTNKERVLILTPLRDASPFLAQHFDLISQLTYPHELIDLAFLVGDSTDDTLAVLAKELERVQKNPENAFRSAMIVEKDFGVTLSQDVEYRHSFEAQGPRRKAMGRARNYLLSAAMKPEHSWVYWRDVDIKDSPSKIIEDFQAHDVDVLVPNVWFHRYKEQNGKMVDIEGRCEWTSHINSELLLTNDQSTTTPGKNPQKASSSPTASTNPSSSLKVTSHPSLPSFPSTKNHPLTLFP
jgi:hypothetical protein